MYTIKILHWELKKEQKSRKEKYREDKNRSPQRNMKQDELTMQLPTEHQNLDILILTSPKNFFIIKV
jgi:hypothetical protein